MAKVKAKSKSSSRSAKKRNEDKTISELIADYRKLILENANRVRAMMIAGGLRQQGVEDGIHQLIEESQGLEEKIEDLHRWIKS